MNIAGAGSAQQGLLQSLALPQRNSAVAQQRVATGSRINSAQDDPAGLAILTSLVSQDQGIEQAITNIQSSEGMSQVGQAAANSVTETLQRARQLGVRAADGSLSDNDRAALNQEMQGLMREVNQTASLATYNGKTLLGGTASVVQTGANEGETTTLNVDRITTDSLFGKTPDLLSIGTQQQASQFITQVDAALGKVGQANLNMGAFSNGLQRTLDLQRQNLTATSGATASIGSADMALEITNQTVASIMGQANLAMVAQNNANSATVLKLFG